MRSILRITKTELRILFYSPVAWLVLIVFALQAGIAFCANFMDELRSQALGYALYTPTAAVFCRIGWGCYTDVGLSLSVYSIAYNGAYESGNWGQGRSSCSIHRLFRTFRLSPGNICQWRFIVWDLCLCCCFR